MARTLSQLYALTQADLTAEEWENRQILHSIISQHNRWQCHSYYSGKHQMPDGTYAHLYDANYGYLYPAHKNPVYTTQAWKNWVTSYRANYWDREWGCAYQPICAKDCWMTKPHCACGEMFHGLKLVEGKLVPLDVPAAQPTEVVDNHPTCVVCAKPAEDGRPYCSLGCESHSKYEEDQEWQEALAKKQEALAKKQEAEEYMTVEEFRRRFR